MVRRSARSSDNRRRRSVHGMNLKQRIPLLRWSVSRLAVGARNIATTGQIGDGREAAAADYVLSNAREGDINDVLATIDQFAYEKSGLINVGDEEGALPDSAVGRADPGLCSNWHLLRPDLVLESTYRLADPLRRALAPSRRVSAPEGGHLPRLRVARAPSPACRSAWSSPTRGRAVPAPRGHRRRPPADVSRTNGAAYAATPPR
jgi:hypothetical protein